MITRMKAILNSDFIKFTFQSCLRSEKNILHEYAMRKGVESNGNKLHQKFFYFIIIIFVNVLLSSRKQAAQFTANKIIKQQNLKIERFHISESIWLINSKSLEK